MFLAWTFRNFYPFFFLQNSAVSEDLSFLKFNKSPCMFVSNLIMLSATGKNAFGSISHIYRDLKSFRKNFRDLFPQNQCRKCENNPFGLGHTENKLFIRIQVWALVWPFQNKKPPFYVFLVLWVIYLLKNYFLFQEHNIGRLTTFLLKDLSVFGLICNALDGNTHRMTLPCFTQHMDLCLGRCLL